MIPLHRRDWLRTTVFAGTLPFTGAWATPNRGEMRNARDFSNGALKGFVLGGPERESALIDAMADMGANLTRVGLRLRRCDGCSGFERSLSDLIGLRRLLDRAASRSLGVAVATFLDGDDYTNFWLQADLRKRFVDHWSWLSRAIGQHQALAGWDLLNEPNPPWPSGDFAEAQAAWRPTALQALAAIRAENAGIPVIYEGAAGGGAFGLYRLEPLPDSNIVYSLHFYSPHDLTHQRVSPAWQRRVPYPAEAKMLISGGDPRLGYTRFDASRLALELAAAREFQLKHRVPIYVGEFSCVRWAPQGSAARWVKDCLNLFANYGWSWTYHEFRGWPGWDAEIDSEDADVTLRSPDAPVITLLKTAMH